MKKILLSTFLVMFAGFTQAFPLTFEHRYGETLIAEQPIRVATLGVSDHDEVIASGVTPVLLRDWYGGFDHGVWPWAQDALGDGAPLTIKGDIDFELVAKAKPDVIIAIASSITPDEYAKLSAIAPTIAPQQQYIDRGTPWDVRAITIGKVLGKQTAAEKRVQALNHRIETIRAENPQFNGASAAVAFYYDGSVGAYQGNDRRPYLMHQLGFTSPTELAELAGDAFYVYFSEEKLELIDTDVLVWISAVNAEEDVQQVKLRPTMRAYKEGREVFVNKLLGGAFSYSSTLSLNYLFDELVPQLADAIDGDPNTKVQSNGL